MNVKHIAATLAILGSASFAVTGCKKNAEGTEVPAAEGEKKADGSCGAKGDGSCGAKGDGSCSAKPAGDAAAGGETPPAEGTPPAAN